MNDDLERMWDESESDDQPDFDEEGFRDWYDRWATVTGLDSDPDDPGHEYDYRAAYLEDAEPEFDEEAGAYHWPSRFKRAGHPNRYVEGWDTKTGEPALRPAAEGTALIGKTTAIPGGEVGFAPAEEPQEERAASAMAPQGDVYAPSEARFAPKEDLASMWEESLPGSIAQSVEPAAQASMRAAGVPWSRPEDSPGLWEALKGSAADTYDSSKRLLKGAWVLAQRTPSIVADYIPETVGRALRGGRKSASEETWLDRWIEENRLEGERAKKVSKKEEGELWFTMPFTGQKVTLKDADQAAKSIGYSLANMLATMAGGAVGTLVGGAAGVASGGPAGAVGGALAGRIAGGAVTGTIFSGEATKDEFIDEIRRSWLAARGNPKIITPELEREWKEIYRTIESDADWYGFWEGFPETVGNMLTLGIASLGRKVAGQGALASIKNRIAEQVGKGLAAKLGLNVGKAAAMLTEESLTETWTQYKQAQIEAELGLRDRPVKFEEAFLEVLPQTVINTAVMGPFAAGVSKVGERLVEDKAKAKHAAAIEKYVSSLRSGLESGTITEGDVFELTMGLDWADPALAPLKDIVGAPIVESVRANVEAGQVNAADVAEMLGRMNKAHPAYEEIRKLAGAAGESEAGAKGFEAATEDELKVLRAHLAEKMKVEGGEEAIVVRAATGNRQRELVQQAGAAFGRRIVFYAGEGAADRLNGLYEPGSDTIFINQSAENPYLVVLGHESLHRLKARHGDLYEKLIEATKDDTAGLEKWLKGVNAGRKAAGLRELSADEALAREEHFADFAGQQFADPKFWERINQHDESLGKRLAGYVHEILEKIRAFLRKMGAAPQYFAQVNRVQDALASVYTEFARREKQVADGTAQPVAAARGAEPVRREAPVRAASVPPAAPPAEIPQRPAETPERPAAHREAPARTVSGEAGQGEIPATVVPAKKPTAGEPRGEEIEAEGKVEPQPEKEAPAKGRALFTPEQLAEFDRLGIDVSGVTARYKEEALQQIESRKEHEQETEAEYNERKQRTPGAFAKPEGIGAVEKPKKRRPKSFGAPTKEKVRTLRGRIKQLGGINFLNFQGELRDMPTAVKFLSKKSAMGVDQVEQILRDEGWIGQEESLLDVLVAPGALKRGKVVNIGGKDERRPEEKTEQEKRYEREMAWEPEEPPEGRYVQMRAEELPEGKKLTIIESKSRDGWDVYRVVEKDPFGVVLQDGTEITLGPDDIVEVRQADLETGVPAEEEILASLKPAAEAFGVRPEALRAAVEVEARKVAGGRKGLKAARGAVLDDLRASAKDGGKDQEAYLRARALNLADPLRGLYAEILHQRSLPEGAELPPSAWRMVPTKEVYDWERGNYVSPSGVVFQSSRTVPMPAYPWREGTWRIYDDHFGPYGRMVEVLRRVPVDDLVLTEEDYTKGARVGRAEDADRYAGWLREGKTAPPIDVLESDQGNLVVTNGHRRVAAAKMAGRKTILAWVSPRMDTGLRDSSEKPIYAPATYEGLTFGVERAKKLYERNLERRMALARSADELRGERFAVALDKVIEGEVANVAQEAAGAGASERLKGIEVDVPAVDEAGTVGLVRVKADEAVRESDKQLEFARRLLECLND